MKIQRSVSLLGIALAVLVAGCGPAPAPVVDTGAKEIVHLYYEALFHQHWQQAFSAVHPDSRSRFTQEQFNISAKIYYRNLGFEPNRLHVQSCEEHGSEATAHVVLSGRGKTRHVKHKDAVFLRKHATGWGIILPANFGKRSRHAPLLSLRTNFPPCPRQNSQTGSETNCGNECHSATSSLTVSCDRSFPNCLDTPPSASARLTTLASPPVPSSD